MKEYLNGIQHIGLPTQDMDKTIAFYEGLGFEVAYKTVLDGDRVTFLKLANLVLETYEVPAAAMADGAIDHVAIEVSDIDACFAEAKKAGYQMLETEVQYLPFWANGVKFFNIVGPNHEKIEFSQML